MERMTTSAVMDFSTTSGDESLVSKNLDKCAFCGVNRKTHSERKYFRFLKDPEIWYKHYEEN